MTPTGNLSFTEVGEEPKGGCKTTTKIKNTKINMALATSVCASEWGDDIAEALEDSTVLNDQIYVFGRRRWLKPGRKWRTPTSRGCNGEKQTKLDAAFDAQARIINRVFMFGSAARETTKNKSSLPALQELPSPQDLAGNQVKIQEEAKALVQVWQI